MSVSSHSLGIDFGTSNTVAIVRRSDGRVEPLLFDGSPLLPSAVFAGPDGLLVGRDAIDSARTSPHSFEPNPKRRIDDGSILLGDEEIPVVEVFGAVLARVRREAMTVLGGEPAQVTVTYPASWGSARRLTLRDAAVMAGLPEPVMVAEPVAAATYFARQLEHDIPDGAPVVVHDFGGGTFDASVVRRSGDTFEVLSVDGLDDLGGIDVDAAIIDHLRSRFDDAALWQRLLEPETPNDRRLRRTFMDDVRSAKERLSRQTSADIYLPLFDVDVHLTRDELETLTQPMIDRAVRLVRAVIRASGVSENAMAGLFLVGGASRMPLIATLLHRELGTAPIVVDQIEQVVAHGALLAAQTASSSGGSISAPLGALSPPLSPPVTPPSVSSPLTPPPFDMSASSSASTSSPMTPPNLLGRTAADAQPTPSQPEPFVMVPQSGVPVGAKKSAVGFLAAGSAVVVIVIAALFVIPAIMDFTDASSDDSRSPLTKSSDFDSKEEEEEAEDDASPDSTYSLHNWSIKAMEIIDLDGRAAVVSGAHTDSIRVWDAETGEDIAEFAGHDNTHDSVSSIESTILDGKSVVVSTGWGTEILVWDPATGKEIRSIPLPEYETSTIIATGIVDGDPVVAAATSCGCGGEMQTRVYVWNLTDGSLKCEWTAGLETAHMNIASVDGESRVVMSGLDSDEKPVLDVHAFGNGELIERMRPQGDTNSSVYDMTSAVSESGEPVALTAAPGAPVEVWDAETESSSFTFVEHAVDVDTMDLTTWGDRLIAITGDDNDVFYVWDVETGEVLFRMDFDDIDSGDWVGFVAGLDTVAARTVGDRLIVAVSSFIPFKIYTWSFEM